MGLVQKNLLNSGKTESRPSIQSMLHCIETAIAERTKDFKMQVDGQKQRNAYRLLRVKHGVAWLLPDSYESAKFVYDNWNSYGRLSRFMLPLLKASHRSFDSAALFLLPKIHMVLPAFLYGSPIYLSIDGNRARALAILKKDGEAIEVLKIPGSAADKVLFIREYENLLHLSPLQVRTPRALWQSKISGAFSQQFLKGKASAPKFTQRHLEFLLKLRKFPLNYSHYSSASASLLPSDYFIHGDFAPWNIKLTEHDHLAVFDWEYGCATGAPGIDLAYYFLSIFSYLKDVSAFGDWLYWSERYCSLQNDGRSEITVFRHDALIACFNYLQVSTKDQLLMETCETWIKIAMSDMETPISARKLPD